jgi:hypothetical protein
VAPVTAVALGVLAVGLGLANVTLDLRDAALWLGIGSVRGQLAGIAGWHRDLPLAVPGWAAAAGAMAAHGCRPDRRRGAPCAGWSSGVVAVAGHPIPVNASGNLAAKPAGAWALVQNAAYVAVLRACWPFTECDGLIGLCPSWGRRSART